MPQRSRTWRHCIPTSRRWRREEEEAAGIRLVHLLMSCADAVQVGDAALESAHLAEAHAALAAVSAASAIGRVAVHFTAALYRRLFPPSASPPPQPDVADNAFLYHHFYEACPYLKFAHFTANQAIRAPRLKKGWRALVPGLQCYEDSHDSSSSSVSSDWLMHGEPDVVFCLV
ncbi:hypothetical protein EJB05_13469, partial [Eragrostis curvula]